MTRFVAAACLCVSLFLSACGGPQQKPLAPTQANVETLALHLQTQLAHYDAANSTPQDYAGILKTIVEKEMDHDFDLTLRRALFFDIRFEAHTPPHVVAFVEAFFVLRPMIYADPQAWLEAGLIRAETADLFRAEKTANDIRLSDHDLAFIDQLRTCEQAGQGLCRLVQIRDEVAARVAGTDNASVHLDQALFQLPLDNMARWGVLVNADGRNLDHLYWHHVDAVRNPVVRIDQDRLDTLLAFRDMLEVQRTLLYRP